MEKENQQFSEETPTAVTSGTDNNSVGTDNEQGPSVATATLPPDDKAGTGDPLNNIDNPRLRTALKLVRKGIPVFPLQPGSRIPLASDSVDDATTDGETIRGWWAATPDANVAIQTGEESGIFVVVVTKESDGAEGMESLEGMESKHGRLVTHRVHTPSGRQHLYFLHPGKKIDNRWSRFLPGISIRGDRSYVTVPPSTVDGGQYRWVGLPNKAPIPEAPAWLLEMVLRGGHRPPRRKLRQFNRVPLCQRRAVPLNTSQGADSGCDGQTTVAGTQE